MPLRSVRMLSVLVPLVFAATAEASAQLPDYQPSALTGPAGSAPGDSITFFFTIANNGGVPSQSTYGTLYLSVDSNITIADVPVCTFSGLIQNPGSSGYSFSACVIPSGLTNGSYFMGLIMDPGNLAPESNESNNAVASAATISICTDGGREPNRTIATATPLGGSAVVSNVFICGPRDDDFYSVTLNAGQTLTAALVPPSALDYDLEILDAGGSYVGGAFSGPGAIDSTAYLAPTTGTYYIRILGFGGDASAAVPYTLRVNVIAPPTLAVSRVGSTGWDAAFAAQSDDRHDSAAVALSGVIASTTTWIATHSAVAPWVTLTTSGGTGSGMVRWKRNPVGLANGVHVDTITVTATGATGSPAVIYDTLAINSNVPVLTSGVAVTGLAGGVGSAAYFRIDVPLGATSLTNSTTLGAGTVQMILGPPGQAPSATTNNICVSNAVPPGCGVGTPPMGPYYILLRGITAYSGVSLTATVASPPTVALTLSTSADWHAVPSTITATGTDSAGVVLTGTGASSVSWTATHRAAATWNTLTSAAGTGSGMMRFTRTSQGLAAGTYIDTITVTAAATGSPKIFVDTLVVTAPPTVLTNGVLVSGLSGTTGSAQYFTLDAPAGTTQLVASTGGGAGSVYLYVLFQQQVSTFGWFAGSEISGQTPQNAGFTTPSGFPALTTIYVMVRGSGTFSGVDVFAQATSPLNVFLGGNTRRDTAAAGSVALRSDSVTVNFGGTGAGSAAWTATHRASATWNTLTTAGGTGPGKVRWSRNPTGLAAGVYIDTIDVTAAGALGSPTRIIDSLVITPPAATLALGSSSISSWTGTNAGLTTVAQVVTVQLSGAAGSTTAWTATHRAAATWNTILGGLGTGSGFQLYSRNKTGLAAGTYVDTITITAPGAAGSPALFIDTLIVAPSTQLTNATPLPNLSGSDGVGQIFHLIVPAGQARADISTSGGTGNVRMICRTANNFGDSGPATGTTRNCFGLTFFGQQDTVLIVLVGGAGGFSGVTLSASYSSTAQLGLSPPSRWHATHYTASRGSDSAHVFITGGSTPWTASRSAGATYDTVLTTSGNGNGTLYWTRNANGLSSGMRIDTITVTSPGATGSPARLLDTLIVQPFTSVLASGAPLTVGSTGTGADIYLLIVPAGTTQWSVTTSGGSGALELSVSTPQQMFGFRTGCLSANAGTTQSCSATIPGGATAGDTLTVILHGMSYSGVTLTSTVTAPLTMTVLPGSRRDSASVGSTAIRADSATVLLGGTGAGSATWTATHRAAATWVSLTAPAGGTGSGLLRYTRNPTGLAAGVYVDTIVISAPGAAPATAMVVDSFIIGSSLTMVTAPASRWIGAPAGTQFNPHGAMDMAVQFFGPGASSAASSIAHRTAATWNVFSGMTSANGNINYQYNRNKTGLVSGVYVDTFTVTATGVAGSPAIMIDSLIIASSVTQLTSGVPLPGNAAGLGQAQFFRLPIPAGQTLASVTTSAGTGNSTLYITQNGGHAGNGWNCIDGPTGNAHQCSVGYGGGLDTLFIALKGEASGYSGVTVTATFSNTATLSLNPTSTWHATLASVAARGVDSLDINLTGTGVAWTASNRASATYDTLLATSGAGSNRLRWTRNSAGLAAGIYVDSIIVTSPGAINSPNALLDTLVVFPAPIAAATTATTTTHQSNPATGKTGHLDRPPQRFDHALPPVRGRSK